MDIKILARGVAYIALAVALLTTAIALNNRQYPLAETSKTVPLPSTGIPDAELARCKAIGAQAGDDAACKAVWQANRKRFFESKKLYQDRVTDAARATPDLKKPALPLERELSGRVPRTPDDSVGQPK